MMQKITPSLWFDNNAEEAMDFYTSVFKNSKIVGIMRYPEGAVDGPMKDMGGKVLHGEFELDGQKFTALDGGPLFKFNESISFIVDCEDQEEVDYYWGSLSAVPEAEQCGWLKDKFGVSWQIIPKDMGEMLSDADQERAGRALQAMLQMKKIEVAALRRAFDGEQL